MRKNRFIGQDRCYHLVSRLAHRAFFLDDEEKDRAVALMRRVEEFCGVVVLAYAFMSNHFHIFVYVPKAEEIDEAEVMRRIRALSRDASLAQVVATWNRLKTEERELFSRARPTKKYVSRFEAYKASFVRRMWNSSEFMRTFIMFAATNATAPTTNDVRRRVQPYSSSKNVIDGCRTDTDEVTPATKRSANQ